MHLHELEQLPGGDAIGRAQGSDSLRSESQKRCASMAPPFRDTTGFIPVSGRCPEGYQGFHRSYEMLHVWLIDRPRGPFSTSMMLPPAEVAPALAERKRERGF